MKQTEVPQDQISTYANHKKALYAVDERGNYATIESSGWSVEEEVTKQALEELERQAQEAYEIVKRGEKSPLYYHMYAQRMDPDVLAQSVGMFKWRVKRHFKPAVYARLNETIMQRYGDALGLSVEELRILPPKEDNDR